MHFYSYTRSVASKIFFTHKIIIFHCVRLWRTYKTLNYKASLQQLDFQGLSQDPHLLIALIHNFNTLHVTI